MTNKLIWFLLGVSLFISCYSKPVFDWHVVYQADKNGEQLSGDKAILINAIRSGKDIKIGWGSQGKNHTIEHISEPIWLAILDEQEVVARLDPQVGGKVDWEKLNAHYEDTMILNTEWRVIITSKGSFDAVWINRQTNEISRRVPQNHPMTWYAYTDKLDKKNVPLFE